MNKRTARSTGPSRQQRFALIAALLLVVAFGVSFVLGLGRGAPEQKPGAEMPLPVAVGDARARVEVLNGAGKPGLAKLATEQLRAAGFDVVQFGNAATPASTSYVIDRVGKRSAAAAVGDALGIMTVRTQIDTSRYVDATVTLGKDWPPLKPEAKKRSLKDKLLRR